LRHVILIRQHDKPALSIRALECSPQLRRVAVKESHVELRIHKEQRNRGAQQSPGRGLLRVERRIIAEIGFFVLCEHDFIGGRALLAAESAGRRELLLDLLRGRGIKPAIYESFAAFMAGDASLGITVSATASGLRTQSPPLEIPTESQLFGDRARQERRRRRSERDPAKILKELSDLRVGAPVVHESYGVGRYVGLQTMDVAGYTGEFLVLEYADGDKLYVPVQSLHLVSRYTGAPAETAPLHKLGGDQWQKARRKAAQRIRDVAAELLDLYSRRAAREGTSMQAAEADYRAFQAGFRFEETADQAAAIEQVVADLKSGKPMDRVICGDVGFGKTEVALRAAFVAVQAGKQVAILVPTTLLAQQHYTTFVDRFADWPVRVESLSRFRSNKEAAAVIDNDVREGRADQLRRVLMKVVKELGNAGNQVDGCSGDAPGEHGFEAGSHAEADDEAVLCGSAEEREGQSDHIFVVRREDSHVDAVDE